MGQENRYGYVLKQNVEKKEPGRYHKADLLLMSAYQLKEICRSEKIIQGVVNQMDREELVRVILRYRGADEYLLIRTHDGQGLEALECAMEKCTLTEREDIRLECSSRIVAHEGTVISFYDGLTLPYDRRIAGTNALVVGGDGTICAILNVEAKGDRTDHLYLTKAAGLPSRESGVKNYSLYCMGRRNSELLYRIYHGGHDCMPEHMEAYRIPLLDFEARKPVSLSMPLAMDFGTTNTTAGVYLDSRYFEQTGFSSVVGVLSVEEGETRFLFGYEAIRAADASYIDEGFCIFYDIKRWIGDYEKQEEITDRQGRRGFVRRRDILKAYFTYLIDETRNRFKCEITAVHISCPVKQKAQFQRLFAEILPEYAMEGQDMLDEGVSVLYGTISEMAAAGRRRTGRNTGRWS